MAFFVYVGILLVAISGILLELDWLTKPKHDAKSPMQTAASVLPSSPPAKPTTDVASDQLNPVYPKKPEVARVIVPPPARQPAETTGSVQQAGVAQTPTPVMAATTDPAQQSPPPAPPVVTAKAEAAPPSPAQPAPAAHAAPANPSAPTPATEQTANMPPQGTAPNKCEIDACAAAYSSFRASDCTYQPFSGERRVCEKPPTRTTATTTHRRTPDDDVRTAARQRGSDDDEQPVSRRRGRDDETGEVDRVEHRVRPADSYEGYDDDDNVAPARAGRRIIVIERPTNRGWFW